MKFFFTFLLIAGCYFNLWAQNRGLNFDGIDDYVSVSPRVAPANFMTLEQWFNPSAAPQGYQHMINGGQYYYAIWNYGGTWAAGSTLYVELYTVGFVSASVSYVLPSSIADSWHHVAFTYNGTALIVYLDGAEVGQAPLSGALPVSGGEVLVLSDPNYPYKGTIDELRIWDVARTQAQIQSAMFSEIPVNSPGLVSYYKFNQGTIGGNNAGVSTLNDAVATPRNGNLANFALSGPTSNWVAGYPPLTVLPLKLTSFTAEKEGGSVTLQWKAGELQDIPAFEIERSSDGLNFFKIGSVSPVRNGLGQSSYTFKDNRPGASLNYYRLRVVEDFRRVTYSAILLIRMDATIRMEVFPNPATNVLQLQTTQKGEFTVFIQDGMQRIIKTLQLTSNSGFLTTNIDVSNFPKGLYFIRVEHKLIKFLKQ